MGGNRSYASPLRYPGGKANLWKFIEDILYLNDLEGAHLVELYAGGAGASLELLLNGVASKLHLNDLDRNIYSFWHSVLHETDAFLQRLSAAEITVESWSQWRDIYLHADDYSSLDVGFAAFMLNRTNMSGIIATGRPIGGLEQTGKYKIDARFNRPSLIARIERIADRGSDITISRNDAEQLLANWDWTDKTFMFIDPPYYDQGQNLYLNAYEPHHHESIRDALEAIRHQNWLLTYDNAAPIVTLYSEFRVCEIDMRYTLNDKRKAKEVAIFPDSLLIPKVLRRGKTKTPVTLC